jgi:DNA replication and repair protein RecF
MYLQKLSLVNFKNYLQAELSFSGKINCFVGNNGVGKTNLLDAIHYLSLCKSYFNNFDSQNIRHGEDYFIIQGNYLLNNSEEEIYCGFKRNNRKVFRRNKKEYERLADHIGLIPAVMVSPSDISLITEGSEERRRLIDSIISQYDKLYLDDIIHYNRILLQRNSLLKEFNKNATINSEMLDIYSEQLANYGDRIFQKRNEFISSFKPIFQKYYSTIAGVDEKAELKYHSQLQENNLRQLLSNCMGKDKVLEYTTAGTHKDDLLLELNGYPVKRIASQGQQKTYVVALKLAEFDFIARLSNKKPLLLLDDIFDKFDPGRVKQIIHLASDEHFGQIFITDTELHRIETVLKEISFDHSIFIVGDTIEKYEG